MSTTTAAAELAEHGYTIIEDVLDAGEIAHFRRRLDELYAAFDPAVDPAGYDVSTGARGGTLEEAPPEYRWASNLVSKGHEFRALMQREPVVSLIRSVLGDDCVLSSMNSLEPLEGHGHQALHRDEGPIGPEGPVVANSIWVLDDMDRSNGATRFVPGTHTGDELTDDTDPRLVYARVRAGSVLVTNAHMLHGASRNLDGRRRRVVHVYYSRPGRPIQTDWGRYVPPDVKAALTDEERRLLGL